MEWIWWPVARNPALLKVFSRSEIAASVIENGFAQPLFQPEFLLPMVIHRKVGSKVLSTAVETCCRLSGLTQLFGSPIMLYVGNLEKYQGIDLLIQSFQLAFRQCCRGNLVIIGGSPDRKIHIPALPFQLAGSICEKICIPFGIEPPIYRRRVDFFTKSRSFDISKAKRLLGYSPQYGLFEGLRNTAQWYKEQGLL